MRKLQVLTFTGIAIIIVLTVLPMIIDSIFTFLLAGFIPGTSLTISPTVIFVVTVLAIGFVVAHLIINASSRYIRHSTDQVRKAVLPGRRFHRL